MQIATLRQHKVEIKNTSFPFKIILEEKFKSQVLKLLL